MTKRDRSLPAVALLTTSLLAGCSDDGSATTTEGMSTTDSDGSEGEEQVDPGPARGISIIEVELNQGTRIPIGVEGGEWVDGPDRMGFLIASRDSLLRIHYEVEEGWEPTEIEARLTLSYPDGTSEVLTKAQLVEDSSYRKNFNSTFWFGLAAELEQTIAGTEFQIELWEVEGGSTAAYAEGDWVNPAAGSRLIGFEQVPMQIKTLLVPITYQGVTANLDEETSMTVLNNLYEQNPTTEIIYSVREPYTYEQQLTDLGQLLPAMSALHANEQAEPNLYYHALVNVGSQALNSTLGISYLTNDNQSDGDRRVSATVLWEPNPNIAADTYTHETGHAQGLSHVECPNRDAANPNPSYPHQNGRIGNWGFGIRRFLMYDPDDAFDYMSYCSPSWVSDWTWNRTYQRIKTLTSWDFGNGTNDSGAWPEQDLLMGAIYPDGSRQWWTARGAMDPDRVTGLDRFEFELDSGERVETYADVSLLSDGEIYWVAAPLPAAREHITGITHVHGDELRTVLAEDIRPPVDLDQVIPNQQREWRVFKPSVRAR